MAKILFFGKLADSAGMRERVMKLDGPSSIADIIDAIESEDPSLAVDLRSPTVRIIVNEEMATSAMMIGDNDELAFLPPVSGG